MGGDDEQQRWRINVHAKSPKFSLKMKASATPHAASKPHDVALKLKSPTHRRGFLRSMFRGLFKRARPPSRLAQSEASSAAAIYPTSACRLRRLAREEPAEVWTVLLVAFALGAVAAVAVREAIVGGKLGFVPIFLVLFSPSSLVLLKKYVIGINKSDLHLILSNLVVVVIVLGAELCDLGKHFGFSRTSVVKYLCKALKLTA